MIFATRCKLASCECPTCSDTPTILSASTDIFSFLSASCDNPAAASKIDDPMLAPIQSTRSLLFELSHPCPRHTSRGPASHPSSVAQPATSQTPCNWQDCNPLLPPILSLAPSVMQALAHKSCSRPTNKGGHQLAPVSHSPDVINTRAVVKCPSSATVKGVHTLTGLRVWPAIQRPR